MAEKYTYTDGCYFCNLCDRPHEDAELAEACYDDCAEHYQQKRIR